MSVPLHTGTRVSNEALPTVLPPPSHPFCVRLCRETPPTEVSQQLARGLGKFPCENVVYTLRPAGSTILGEMSVSITQAYREQGRPLASCPKEACQVYSYRVRERQISRTVNLRVEPRG